MVYVLVDPKLILFFKFYFAIYNFHDSVFFAHYFHLRICISLFPNFEVFFIYVYVSSCVSLHLIYCISTSFYLSRIESIVW